MHETQERLARNEMLRDFIKELDYSTSKWSFIEYPRSALWKCRDSYHILRVNIDKMKVSVDLDGYYEGRIRSIRVKGKAAMKAAAQFLQNPEEVMNEHLANG